MQHDDDTTDEIPAADVTAGAKVIHRALIEHSFDLHTAFLASIHFAECVLEKIRCSGCKAELVSKARIKLAAAVIPGGEDKHVH